MKNPSLKRAYHKLVKELKRERKNAKPAPHFSNTSNPVDFPKMTKYVHIVQVHPVENGLPNLSKVREEKEFESHFNALTWVETRNGRAEQKGEELKAVYHGRVNDATGELE